MKALERSVGFLAAAMLVTLALWLPSAASAAPPLATTGAATEVAKETAKLNGVVNPTGLPTTFWFEYGTTKSYGLKTAEASAGFGSLDQAVSVAVKGLAKGTLYHFRVVAKNFTGTTVGTDQTFTTHPIMALTEPATKIFSKEATLNGRVFTEGVAGNYYFEYGTSEAYGSKTPELKITNFELQSVSATISGLTPATAYHYRVVEVSGGMTRVGADGTFTTAAHTWYKQTTPNPLGGSNRFEGVSCLSGTECVAVGDGPIAAKWNGTEWSSMTIPGGGELDNVSCTSFSACTAVGITWVEGNYAPLVERWNGSEWKIQEVPIPGGSKSTVLHGVSCTSATHCVAVGNYWTGGEGNWWPLVIVWNGSEWKLQEAPPPAGKIVNYVYDVSCSSSTACTAVGYSSMNFLVERWNGTEWKVQAMPNLGGLFEGVSCSSSTFCMAVGEVNGFEPSSGGDPYAASWNGAEWKTLSPPSPAEAGSGRFQGVSCTASTACSVVGGWSSASTNYALAESWNGSSWTIQPVVEPASTEGTELRDVACLSTFLCEAVGAYSVGGWAATFASLLE